ncbi:hypothetical protein SAMN05660479_03168 [Microbulbifer thermotolerans]|nr:hypothetical protein SAMN05660479_03168 [Microbulbifer thermotolerans]
MLILLVIFFHIGATLMYLGHRNQCWISRSLSPKWGWCGTTLTVATLLVACNVYPVNTAIFTWLSGLMLLWGLLPFVSLLWKTGNHD